LLSGIRVAAVPEFDDDLNAFVGAQLHIQERVRLVRLGGAFENPDNFLHVFTPYSPTPKLGAR